MTHWSKLPKNEVGSAVDALIKDYKGTQVARKNRFLRNLELYELRKLGHLGGEAYYGAIERPQNDDPDRLRLVHSAIESVKASIYAPQKPKPQFQTLGATWAARRKAYKLDRICEGLLNQRQAEFANVWAFVLDWATDAPTNGTAVMKVTADKANQAISYAAIPNVFMFVDPLEGRTPKNFFEIAPVDRDSVVNAYGGDVKKALDKAARFDWLTGASTSRIANDIVEQQFAWRLPWGKDKPGRYVTVIGGQVIDESEWDLPAPPFVFLHWIRHRHEFWGSGIADEGAALAEDAADLDFRLGIRARLASGKRIYIDSASSVDVEKAIGNEPITVVRYSGQPPIEVATPPFDAAETHYRDTKVQNFWDAIGVSQVSAAARREQGISSGIGLMTLNDTKAGRQLPKGQAFENVFVDIAHQQIWRCRELYQDDPKFSVKWPGKRLFMQVKWADTEIEDDMLSVSVAPASSLPHDPAGRQEMVQQLFNSQIISKETAQSLIGWPDLDSELDLQNSELEYIDMLIDMYLDADPENWDNATQYQAPEAYLGNKMGALRRFASSWFRARIDQQALDPEERGRAEFNIKMLSRYMGEMSTLIDREKIQTLTSAQVAAQATAPGAVQG